MDRFESMSVLLTVVEAGSLSAGGRKLGMPLPTVSRKVSELETHLKARLLNRSTRQLSLTDAGRAYVAACKRIVEDVNEAERAASGEYSSPRGELIVTAPIVFGRLHLLPVASDFLKAYPDINLRIVLGDRVINLLEDPVDAAIRIGTLPDSSLIATRVGLIHQTVCGSPAYFAAHGKPQTPQDLAAHQCIAFEATQPSNTWAFKIEDVEVQTPIRPRLIVNTAEAARDAAMAGVGITRILSYQADEAMRAGLLEGVLEDFQLAPVPVSLVYPSQSRLPQKLRAFLDFATPRLRNRLSTEA